MMVGNGSIFTLGIRDNWLILSIVFFAKLEEDRLIKQRAERQKGHKMKKFMNITLYKTDRGETNYNSGTNYNTITKIEVEADNYIITEYNIWTNEEATFKVPMDKYEIVINKFN